MHLKGLNKGVEVGYIETDMVPSGEMLRVCNC